MYVYKYDIYKLQILKSVWWQLWLFNFFSFDNTVNQLNLTAVKIGFLKMRTYLVQENLAFWKGTKVIF